MFSGKSPGGIIKVVGADVASLLVVHVNAACRDRAPGLGSDGRLPGKLAVELVDALGQVLLTAAGVIEPLHIHDARKALAPIAVHGLGNRASGIKRANQPLHAPGDARATRSALFGLLIADGPNHHARMVTVAADQAFELAQALGIRRHHAGLVHHQHAQTVAGVKQLGRGRIVGSAVGIRAHLLEALDAVGLQPVRERRAHAGMVLVIARALDFHGLAVQEKSLIRVETNGADTELRFEAVGRRAFAIHGAQQAIKIRLFNRPQQGMAEPRLGFEGRASPGGNPRGLCFHRGHFLPRGIHQSRGHLAGSGLRAFIFNLSADGNRRRRALDL